MEQEKYPYESNELRFYVPRAYRSFAVREKDFCVSFKINETPNETRRLCEKNRLNLGGCGFWFGGDGFYGLFYSLGGCLGLPAKGGSGNSAY